MKSNRPAYNRSVGAPRLTPPEATPGFAARWAAAQAIGDALTLARPLEERFPGLGKQVEEGMAVAIDGEIFQDAYSAKFGADSEVVLIPKIGGG